MAYPRLVPLLAVECGALYVLVFIGAVIGNNSEHLAAGNVHAYIGKERAAYVVDRESGCHRIESERREYYKTCQTTAVFVSGDTHKVISEPSVETLSDAFLGFPWSTCVVIDVGDMERRLVGHGKLADIAGLVGKLLVEFTFASSHRFRESLVKIFDKLFTATHHLAQVGEIVLNVPTVSPAVVFIISVTGAYAAAEPIIKRLKEFTVFIFGMEKFGFGIPHCPVVVAELIVLGSFFFLPRNDAMRPRHHSS